MASTYTLNMQINEAQLANLNYPVDFVREEIHSLLISYGDCDTRYIKYVFPSGFEIFYCLVTLMKMYPAFQSFMYRFQIVNKRGETVELMNFLS